jgi:hypothetical protein
MVARYFKTNEWPRTVLKLEDSGIGWAFWNRKWVQDANVAKVVPGMGNGEVTLAEITEDEALRLTTPEPGPYNPPWLEEAVKAGLVEISNNDEGGYVIAPVGPGKPDDETE